MPSKPRGGTASRPKRARPPRVPPRHEATFTVEVGPGPSGQARLAALEAALRPELAGGADSAPAVRGDTVTMRRTSGGRGLEVRVASRSLPSLRAALNGHMRMAALALAVAAVAAGDDE